MAARGEKFRLWGPKDIPGWGLGRPFRAASSLGTVRGSQPDSTAQDTDRELLVESSFKPLAPPIVSLREKFVGALPSQSGVESSGAKLKASGSSSSRQINGGLHGKSSRPSVCLHCTMAPTEEISCLPQLNAACQQQQQQQPIEKGTASAKARKANRDDRYSCARNELAAAREIGQR